MEKTKNKVPIINCYSKLAAIFSVLTPHKNTYAWIFSNYCQMLFYKDLSNDIFWIDLCNDYSPLYITEWTTCPFISFEAIDYKTSEQLGFEDFIINSIEEGKIIYITVNCEKLSEYGNRRGNHDLLITGFDYKCRRVLCQDYFNNFYEQKSIEVSRIEKSVFCFEKNKEIDTLGKIFTLKYKEPLVFPYIYTAYPSKNIIKNHITANLSKKCNPLDVEGLDILTGIEVYHELIISIKSDYNLVANWMPFCAIRDHIKVLNSGLIYIDNNTNILYKKLIQFANLNINYSMKAALLLETGKKITTKIIDTVCNNLESIYNYEKQYIERLE